MKAIFSIGVVSGMLMMNSGYAANPVAHLQQIRGLVLVSQDSGFSTADEGMALRSGDRVMVMEGGAASLVYSKSCQADYTGSQIITVGSAGCKSGTTQPVDPMFTAVAGAGTGALGAGTIAGFSAVAVVAGVVAITAIAVVATSDSGNSDGEPISQY